MVGVGSLVGVLLVDLIRDGDRVIVVASDGEAVRDIVDDADCVTDSEVDAVARDEKVGEDDFEKVLECIAEGLTDAVGSLLLECDGVPDDVASAEAVLDGEKVNDSDFDNVPDDDRVPEADPVRDRPCVSDGDAGDMVFGSETVFDFDCVLLTDISTDADSELDRMLVGVLVPDEVIDRDDVDVLLTVRVDESALEGLADGELVAQARAYTADPVATYTTSLAATRLELISAILVWIADPRYRRQITLPHGACIAYKIPSSDPI